MVVSETYTQGNLNPSAHEAVTLYASREPTAEEVSYINQHSFDNASAYVKSKGWKLTRKDTCNLPVKPDVSQPRLMSNCSYKKVQENSTEYFTAGVSAAGMWICIILAGVVFFSIVLNDGSHLLACVLSIGLNLLGVWFYQHGPKGLHNDVAAEQRRKLEKRMTGGYKCPSCGKFAGHPIGVIDKGFSIGTFGLASNKVGKTYKCENCGYMW